jgi:hypothetical protein
MDKKKIILWGMILLIGLMLTGCATYDAGYYDYPYYYYDYNYGYPYYGHHHEFGEHREGGVNITTIGIKIPIAKQGDILYSVGPAWC